MDGVGSVLLVTPALVAAGIRPLTTMEAVKGGTRKQATIDDRVIIACVLSHGSPSFDGLDGLQWSRDRLHIGCAPASRVAMASFMGCDLYAWTVSCQPEHLAGGQPGDNRIGRERLISRETPPLSSDGNTRKITGTRRGSTPGGVPRFSLTLPTTVGDNGGG